MLYTIGFTRKSAQNFFSAIKAASVRTVVDVRLRTSSQLAGFAKQADLKYLLHELCQAEYVHVLELAPTGELLDSYKKHRGSWPEYERAFLQLIREREIERRLDPSLFRDACLLCSEHLPDHCHRRLVAEYLNEAWGTQLVIKHLK